MKGHTWRNTILAGALAMVVVGVSAIGIASAATNPNRAIASSAGTASAQPTGVMRDTQPLGAVTLASAPVPTPVSPPASPATPDTAQQMIQACWQMDQVMIDRWVQATGLSREDLLKMEQAWMQSALQKNPNLNLQRGFELHQNWVQGFLNNPPATNQNPQAPASPQSPLPQGNQPYNGGYGPGGWGGWCW